MNSAYKEDGSTDVRVIELSERYQVDYWVAQMGVSEEDLRLAIVQHGSCAGVVRRVLRGA